MQPADWIQVAKTRLAREGIDAVRIEVLCRDLGVSKGSFYWHFRDREDLHSALLSQWEKAEEDWVKEDQSHERSAAARWARLIERGSQAGRMRLEAAIRAWVRQDDRVAKRVAAVERNQREHIVGILREIGFTRRIAEEWSETALLLYLGWLARSCHARSGISATWPRAGRLSLRGDPGCLGSLRKFHSWIGMTQNS